MNEPKLINAGSSGEWGWHATEAALRCPQLFAYYHRIPNALGKDGNRDPLLKGSLVHAGLAHYYARLQSAQAGRDPEEWATPDRAVDACAEELGTASLKFVDMAKQVIREYAAHYATDTLMPLHVEEVFTANIGGRKFTQRLDLVARGTKSGKIYIYDHKTSGRLASIGRRYTLSGQFLGMEMFGREVFGAEFGGVVANVIQLPAKHGDRCVFERMGQQPAPHAQRGFALTVLHARERIEALDASGIDPWEWPKVLSEQVCVTAYGPCDGFDLCRWGRP